MRYLDHKEQSIIIDSLILRIQELQKALEESNSKLDDYSTQLSVFKYFLADNHPELTTEFAEFVLESSQNEDMYGDDCRYAVNSLDYHYEEIDNARLDEIYKRTEK